MTEHAPPPASRNEEPRALPEALRAAPMSQGMAVPYITLAHRDRSDRPAWGNVDLIRLREVLDRALCQICGTPLGEQVILFILPSDFRQGLTVEPGLHPACAEYSARTCPLLAGRMHRYHRHPAQRLTRCADPRCHCWGWVPPRPDPARDGAPTEAWYELRLPLSEYRVITVPGTDNRPAVTGIDLKTPRLMHRIRKIRDAAGASQRERDPLAMLIVVGVLFAGTDQ